MTDDMMNDYLSSLLRSYTDTSVDDLQDEYRYMESFRDGSQFTAETHERREAVMCVLLGNIKFRQTAR
jgi:hypothetical protein